MLPIYHDTCSSTFCGISALKEACENINKHQTALKLELYEHASDWPEEKVKCYPSYIYLFKIFLQQRFVQSYTATEICAWALDEMFQCFRYKATVYFKTDTL